MPEIIMNLLHMETAFLSFAVRVYRTKLDLLPNHDQRGTSVRVCFPAYFANDSQSSGQILGSIPIMTRQKVSYKFPRL